MKDQQKVTIKYQENEKNIILENSLIKKHLKMVHPFLSRKFRTITKAESTQKKVFKEFFGEEKFEAWKLKAIFEFQK